MLSLHHRAALGQFQRGACSRCHRARKGGSLHMGRPLEPTPLQPQQLALLSAAPQRPAPPPVPHALAEPPSMLRSARQARSAATHVLAGRVCTTQRWLRCAAELSACWRQALLCHQRFSPAKKSDCQRLSRHTPMSKQLACNTRTPTRLESSSSYLRQAELVDTGQAHMPVCSTCLAHASVAAFEKGLSTQQVSMYPASTARVLYVYW